MGAAMTLGRATRNAERGFTLIETMIAMVVMTVGLLAVIAVFGTAIATTQSAQEDLIARQKTLEAMESIYTARNSQQIPFTAIANTANGGAFRSGPQPLLCAGGDGLVGTTDDAACTTTAGATCPNGGVECMVLPGPDGVLGTADDTIMSLSNFQRTIAINQVLQSDGSINQNMVAVTVTVSYTQAGLPSRSYTANGLISSYH
jgi:prepilin-type N-terminal cleavage/methylation domain-containing protein